MSDLKLPYSYKHLSLDDIMGDNNAHTYPSGHIHSDQKPSDVRNPMHGMVYQLC